MVHVSFLVYAADVNIRVNTAEKNKLALLVASKDIGQEVNAGKTKYMVMSRDQNAGRSHNMKIDNSSLKGWNNSSIWEQP